MRLVPYRSTIDAEASQCNGRTRRTLRLLTLELGLVLATWLGVALALRSHNSAPGDIDGFVTAPIVRGDLRVVVHATGTVEPTRLIEVSTELTGTLLRVHAKPNDVVKSGQVLAELDPTSANVQVARAKANVAAARARLKDAEAGVPQARAELDRKRALSASRNTTQRELDAAEAGAQRAAAAVATLRAEAQAAEADLQLAETSLAKTRIVAPVDGIVLRRNAEPGQAIAGSLQPPVLFRLAEALEQMQIRVDVDEADAMKVAAGQRATFAVQAVRNQRFEANVERIHIGPEIVQGVVTYKAVLTFDNRTLGLKPGMTASADIVVDEVKAVLLVPTAALRFSPQSVKADAPTPAGPIDRLLGIGPAISSTGTGETAPLPEPPQPAKLWRRIYVVDRGAVLPIQVETGPSDGASVMVRGEGLSEGLRVVVDMADPKP